ncbi:MAG: ABC transporter substrate-binding protein [Anaerolineae bacterium]|nr:ABC transporter substrate-binding protein [Anaerolineae bacterium]
MKRYGVLLLLVALLSIAFTGYAQEGEPIKIAAGYGITGGMSSLDEPGSNGAMLAADEINAAGGVLGRPLELIVRDSQTEPDTTAQIARQFIEEDQVVAGMGFNDSDSALAFAPIFQEAGIPFITAGATSPRLPDQIGDFMFLAPFGDNTQAAVAAEYSFENFGDTAYLLINEGSEFTRLLAGFFKARFEELGGTIVLQDSYELDATDFSAQITRVRALAEQPAFYFVSALPQDIGPVARQMRDAGLTNPIVSGDGADTPLLLEVGGDAANDVYFTTHALMNAELGTERVQAFIAAYNEAYGRDPENAFAALGYDAVYLLADAIERAGSTDAEAIQQALMETEGFAGVTGTVSYAEGSRVPQKAVTMIHVMDEQFTLAGEFVPESVPSPDTE